MESDSACFEYWSIPGSSFDAVAKNSSLIMHMVKPAGPIFFWAPAYIIENLETSIGSLRITEDISAINGDSVSGGWCKALPWIVSFAT